MSETNKMINRAIDVLAHAVLPETIILGDDRGVPVEDQEQYKKDILFTLLGLVRSEI